MCRTHFFINGSPLPVVNSSRDLGITITSTLLFADHITNIVAKAHQRANMIHRCFVSRNTTLLVRAFVTSVRPLLEYNSVTWSSHHKGDTLSIEQAQRRFTKRLHGLRKLSCGERLSVLNLQSLELRRLHCDLICCYKILLGLVFVNSCEFFKLSVTNTRCHHYKLYKQRSYHSARLYLFSERISVSGTIYMAI